MERTVDQWMSILTRRLDFNRPRIARLYAYTNGNAPLPEMADNLVASWVKFQCRSRLNMGSLIVNALADRIVPKGITVEGSSDSPIAQSAARIWRDNRLDVAVPDAMADAFTCGHGYLLVTSDDQGRAVVNCESPTQFYADPDPVRPWRARAAVKVWRDADAGTDYADMFLPGMVVSFSRPSRQPDPVTGMLIMTAVGGWQVQSIAPFTGDVPVVILENRKGLGEFEAQTDSIDRINWGVLQRLVTTAMQAFRQRAIKTSDTGAPIPEVDANGDRIDYAKVFEPGPAALWELPAGVDLWESQTTDLTPMLSAVKDDLRFLSAETQTPVSMLVPDGANQSAAGSEFAREGLTNKAADRIKRFKPALAVMLVKALAVEGTEDVPTIDVMFEPPAMVSLTEKYAAASQAKNIGESLETIQRNILGYSPDQIAEDRTLRNMATLELAAQMASTKPAQQPTSPDTEPVSSNGSTG